MACYNWNFIRQDLKTKKVFLVSKEEYEKGTTAQHGLVSQHSTERYIKVGCGKCDACRLKKANEGGIRCSKEMQNHKDNGFITLTYNGEHLPIAADDTNNGRATLKYVDVQLFLKRLRKGLKNEKIKYLACSEYGGTTGRPHYHLIIFGGQKIGEKLENERNLIIEKKIGGKGLVNIKRASFESAAYVARYTTKKTYKTKKYRGMEKEQLHASQKIGAEWFKSQKSNIISTDLIYASKLGGKMAYSSIPRTWLSGISEEDAKKITETRSARMWAQRERLHDAGINIEEREQNAALRTKEYVRMLNRGRKL